MAITFEDVHDVKATKKKGRLETLTRRGYVSGVEAVTPTSYVEAILNAPAVPSSGSTIEVDGTDLTLVNIDITINDDSGLGDARVELGYERGSSDSEPDSSEVLRRGGRVSVRQVSTALDRDGNRLTVTYNDETVPGELSVFMPQAEPYVETIENTSNPDGLAKGWVGRVNSATFRGEGPGMWMITDASYEEHDAANKYRFRWAFQLSEDENGWLPIVAYVDPNTNQTPVDAEIGNGIEAIPYYYQRDFNSKFD